MSSIDIILDESFESDETRKEMRKELEGLADWVINNFGGRDYGNNNGDIIGEVNKHQYRVLEKIEDQGQDI